MIRVEHFHGMSTDDIDQSLRESKNSRDHERWVCIRSSIHGLSVSDIASILSRNEKTVREWIANFNLEGAKGLLRQSPPGQKKKLSADQVEQIKKDLERPPTDFGFNQGYWTRKLIHLRIKHTSGIAYSFSRISELTLEWGFRIKRPRMKSIKRDEQERRQFVEEDVAKKVGQFKELADTLGLELSPWFTDEAGFRRDGTLHAGYFKIGKIAEIPESNGRFESIKLIGAVNPRTGAFKMTTITGKMTLCKYVEYLKSFAASDTRKFFVIFHDNAPWHGPKSLPTLLREAGVINLGVINLPKYSPDMNPCEKLWYWLRAEVTHCQYHETLTCLMKNIWKFYRRAFNKVEEAKRRFKPETNIFKYCESLWERT